MGEQNSCHFFGITHKIGCIIGRAQPDADGCLLRRRRSMKSISHSAVSRLAAATMLALASLACQTNLIDWGQILPATTVPGTNNGPATTPVPMAETTFN